MKNKAAGLAPWNIQQYECEPGAIVNGEPAVFYHFHGLKWLRTANGENFEPGVYEFSQGVLDYLYRPYTVALRQGLEFVRNRYDNTFIKGILWPEYKIW